MGGHSERAGAGAMVSWAFFDFAAQAFATVVQTFIFAAYFTHRLAPDPETGTELWGFTTAGAGVLLALAAPALGAVADRRGRRKPWLLGFLILCAGATALLGTVRPEEAHIPRALALVAVGIVGVQGAGMFYNAMLSDLAPPERTGAWSSRAWGLGYIGGILALALSLFFVGGTGTAVDDAARLRAVFPFVAAWTILFSLPLLCFTPDAPRKTDESFRRSAAAGFGSLRRTLHRIAGEPALLRFLLARALYFDGLATVFAMGGVYAAGVFGMDEREVLYFGIALNLSAGAGAGVFSFLDDRLGSRRVILIALTGLSVTLFAALVSFSATAFWIAGTSLGFFVGPAQASSRAYLARLAPSDARAQLFGFYAFSSKATAFLGPLLVAGLTRLTHSPRIGMGVVLAFFLSGLFLMRSIPAERSPGRNGVGS